MINNPFLHRARVPVRRILSSAEEHFARRHVSASADVLEEGGSPGDSVLRCISLGIHGPQHMTSTIALFSDVLAAGETNMKLGQTQLELLPGMGLLGAECSIGAPRPSDEDEAEPPKAIGHWGLRERLSWGEQAKRQLGTSMGRKPAPLFRVFTASTPIGADDGVTNKEATGPGLFFGIKELALSTMSEATARAAYQLRDELVASGQVREDRACPGVYFLGDGAAIRLVPSVNDCIVIKARNFEEAEAHLREKRVPIQVIGARHGCNDKGQLQLQAKCLAGLDIRICADPEVNSRFVEGAEALTAGQMSELQPGQSPIRREQHCWSEFHHQVKNPIQFLRGNAARKKLQGKRAVRPLAKFGL